MRCTRIACIDKTPTKTEAKAGSQCWIAGWGSTCSLDRCNSRKLLQSSLNLLSNKYCLENARDWVKSKLHEDEVCAGHPVGTDASRLSRGSNFCNGDSGGPLMCQVGDYYNRRPVLTGVVSWNYKCGDSLGEPGVFARVSFFYDWMLEIVQKNPLSNGPAAWTQWSDATCSVSCGGGTKQRRRKCLSGVTESDRCPGRSTENFPCQTQPCGNLSDYKTTKLTSA